jgi:hypothetical protein
VQFTGVQLNDLRPSSQSSDKQDCDTFFQWMNSHLPFTEYDKGKLVSIATRLILLLMLL